MTLSREPFGSLPGGEPVELFRLGDGTGFEACVMTFGATVQALRVPDRHGMVADVTLGYDTLDGYLAERRFFGATVGRYANRIAGGTFFLDGAEYWLARNNGSNALHGGVEGFDRKLWAVEATTDSSVTLSRVSPDGEEGYPGTVHVSLELSIPEPGALAMDFRATADRATVLNLTHHGFFNLAGPGAGEGILDHLLSIDAAHYLPVDAGAIPLDGPHLVGGTPFDFRTAQRIGARIRDGGEQLRWMRGYDHNFCLPGGRVAAPRRVATLVHPGSGRQMELLTDQPGLQFYSGNQLDGTVSGKAGRLYRQSDAVCLEPQAWPDAPNRPDYPSARIAPGEPYRHRSVFRFGTVPGSPRSGP